MPNMAFAAVILVVGFFLSKWVKKGILKIFHKVIHNDTLDSLFTSIIYVFLLGIVCFTALSVLNLGKVVTTALAGAGILGLALAFAFQDIASNFMSGIFISIRKPLQINDIVKIKDYMGIVSQINLRDTVIKTFQGQMVIIPNKDVLQNPIENYSLLGKRRMDLNLGVSYGDDLEKVKMITLKAVEDMEGLTGDKKEIFFQEFGDSSINFVLRLWVSSPHQVEYLQVRDQAILQIKKAYDANNIMIPFPIRTLDFGIKGGVPLNDIPIDIKDHQTENGKIISGEKENTVNE